MVNAVVDGNGLAMVPGKGDGALTGCCGSGCLFLGMVPGSFAGGCREGGGCQALPEGVGWCCLGIHSVRREEILDSLLVVRSFQL